MSFGCGISGVMLSQGKSDAKRMPLRAACLEAGPERRSRSENLDRARSGLNVYDMPDGCDASGASLAEWYEERFREASEARVAAGGHRLGKNASYGVAFTVTPDEEECARWDDATRERFKRDAVASFAVWNHGRAPDAVIEHRDEGSIGTPDWPLAFGYGTAEDNFHLHIFSQCLTEDGRLAVGESFNNASRKSELHRVFVEEMRRRGWDMERHKTQRERAKSGERRQAGRSANEYRRTERAARENRARAAELDANSAKLAEASRDLDDEALANALAARDAMQRAESVHAAATAQGRRSIAARKEAEAAKAEAETARAEAETAKRAADEARAATERARASAVAEARAKALQDARAEAEQIKDAARTEAEGITDAARAEAAGVKAEARREGLAQAREEARPVATELRERTRAAVRLAEDVPRAVAELDARARPEVRLGDKEASEFADTLIANTAFSMAERSDEGARAADELMSWWRGATTDPYDDRTNGQAVTWEALRTMQPVADAWRSAWRFVSRRVKELADGFRRLVASPADVTASVLDDKKTTEAADRLDDISRSAAWRDAQVDAPRDGRSRDVPDFPA